MTEQKVEIPLVERLKSIPGVFGIRLTQEPEYELLVKDYQFEIRQYPSLVTATTVLLSNDETSREEGFTRLAGYIFGQNRRHQKVHMTAPVFQQNGESIAMSSPVINQKIIEGWTMSFILPEEISFEDAPIPDDDQIILSAIPSQKWAVLRYTGSASDALMMIKIGELKAWLDNQDRFRGISDARWAQYDGPMVLPFLRRNEVQIQVKAVQ